MACLLLGLGSNLGDGASNLHTAIAHIEQQIGRIVARSAFLQTEPWGFQSEHFFTNACLAVETDLSPSDCLASLQEIERKMGRTHKTHSGRYADRLIDIDILFYDQLVIQEEGLVVPHPLLHLRAFVLTPLLEIAPSFQHPLLHKSIQELHEALTAIS